MAGFLDFLTQANSAPNVTTGSSSSTQLPAYYTQYQQALLNYGASVTQDPYQTYDNQRIADFNPTQQKGFDYINQNAGSWKQPLDAANQTLSQSSQNLDPNNVNQWLSPYQHNVTDEIARLGNQQLTEKGLPQLDAGFTGSGQFGSQRSLNAREQLIRDSGANILGQQATSLNSGYDAASKNMIQAAGVGNSTGQAQINAATQTGNLTGQTGSQLLGVGAQQQSLDQSNLDLGYQDFLNQQNRPRQDVGFLSSVLQGQQVPSSTNSSATGPINSALSPSLLGVISGLAGTYAGLQKPVTAARGGMIPRFARGGLAMVPSRPQGPLSAITRRSDVPIRQHARMAGLDHLRMGA